MKKIVIALTTSATLIACVHEKATSPPGICVSVIADSSDNPSVIIKPNPILSLYKLDNDPSQAAEFRFQVIKNVKTVPVTVFHLPSSEEKDYGGYVQNRKRDVLKFYNQVRNTIATYQQQVSRGVQLDNSECFYIIREELEYLSNTRSERKVLVIISDLFERSFYDSYHEDKTSEELTKLFAKKYPLPKRLDGVYVFMVYNSANRIQDARFDSIMQAYKMLLSAKGAIVKVQAHSNSFDIDF